MSTFSARVERILLVDDVLDNLSVLAQALEPSGYEVLTTYTGAAALKIAEKAAPDLILLDVMMPGLDGFETCRRLKAIPALKETPVIFITARNEMQSLVQGFQAGAVDYIIKPFQTEEVLSRVATHLRIGRLTSELRKRNQELSEEIERRKRAERELREADDKIEAFADLEASRGNIGGLIGGSSALRKTVEEIRRLNHFANTTALILGESGTGKELVARAIHFGSERARNPFVPVNCVAIPSELAESILFGHVKGSFTGATSDRKGCFAMADGGTLFLDEIGDMPAALQVKLLRVLEDGYITPVGGSEAKRVNVRVIAATNADLPTRIENGSFRQDLYFRLARYTISTTPLRERIEDVPSLAAHFLKSFAAEMGCRPPGISEQALVALRAYEFPGNIRELKNIIERALIESDGGRIESSHLAIPRRTAKLAGARPDSSELPLNLDAAEDALIQRALQATAGNVSEAARLLGIHRTRIYRKLAQSEVAP